MTTCSGGPGPQRLLWSDGQRQTSGVVPLPGRSHLAEVALTPQPPPVPELGPDEHNLKRYPLPSVQFVRSSTPVVSEPVQVRTECVNRARSALWGAGAQQCPRLPGLVFFEILTRAGASNVMLVTLLIPVTALLLGNMFLAETILLYEIAGAATIGLGLLSIDGRLPRRAMRVIAERLAVLEKR